ncbi:uncharacterized protein [Ptychodera flava]|uniref:uncharacterized protein n=1 Tax=Ptychodera flava TaxID=63121 RepID=UPI003969FF26
MASCSDANKLIIHLPDDQQDIEPIILNLASGELGETNLSDLPITTLPLGDSEKRWLVVGICVNKIINPLLRKHVDSRLMTLYSTLKSVHQIDNQGYPRHQKKFPPKSRSTLNYENINSNVALKKNHAAFNYNVTSHVDFAKLFLLPHMAKFSAFDDTCDASALLGLICNIQGNCFDIHLKREAGILRSRIRNPWAHCNFSDWDELKYMESFQVMNSLIAHLNLPDNEEKNKRSELTDWEKKGMKICFGSSVDVKVVAELKEETKSLAKYILRTERLQQDETESIIRHLQEIEENMEKFQLSVQNSVQRDEFAEVYRDLKDLSLDQQIMSEEISQIKDKQKKVRKLQKTSWQN